MQLQSNVFAFIVAMICSCVASCIGGVDITTVKAAEVTKTNLPNHHLSGNMLSLWNALQDNGLDASRAGGDINPKVRVLANDDQCYTTTTTQTVTCGTEPGSCTQLNSGGCKSGYFASKTTKQSCSGPVTATTCYYDVICCPFSASIKNSDDSNKAEPTTAAGAGEGTAELATKSVIFVFLAFSSLYGIVKLTGDGADVADVAVEAIGEGDVEADLEDGNGGEEGKVGGMGNKADADEDLPAPEEGEEATFEIAEEDEEAGG